MSNGMSYESFLLLCEQNRRKNKKRQRVISKLTDKELELLIGKKAKEK